MEITSQTTLNKELVIAVKWKCNIKCFIMELCSAWFVHLHVAATFPT